MCRISGAGGVLGVQAVLEHTPARPGTVGDHGRVVLQPDEAPIAELTFVKSGPQRYQATIRHGDFCEAGQYVLYGDQWRLDAQFLKWRAWANLLGMDSMYRIERLGGRYREVAAENASLPQVHALHDRSGIDLPGLLARYEGPFSPVDTLYGSSVYHDMDPAYIYRVYRGQSGLLVRKRLRLNSVEHRALEPGFGYVRVKSFQERTERNLQRAMEHGPGRGVVHRGRGPGQALADNIFLAHLFGADCFKKITEKAIHPPLAPLVQFG